MSVSTMVRKTSISTVHHYRLDFFLCMQNERDKIETDRKETYSHIDVNERRNINRILKHFHANNLIFSLASFYVRRELFFDFKYIWKMEILCPFCVQLAYLILLWNFLSSISFSSSWSSCYQNKWTGFIFLRNWIYHHHLYWYASYDIWSSPHFRWVHWNSRCFHETLVMYTKNHKQICIKVHTPEKISHFNAKFSFGIE